jgi:subtilase family serine protease
VAPGQTVTLTAVSGPQGASYWTATAGNHTLTAHVDDVNRIAESDETNNLASQTFSVSNGKPDLVIEGLSGFDTTPNPGDNLTFSVTVKNVGTAPTPAGTTLGVGFSIDGKLVTWSDTDKTSLAPGTAVTLRANYGPTQHSYWTATLGTHTLTANVDDVNRIAESNENNNLASKTISVTKPDLVVTSIGGFSSTMARGTKITFSAVVKNVGTAPTPAGTLIGVGFKVDGRVVTWSATDKSSLAPGASVTLRANSGPSGIAYWKATAGTHTVTAHVDDVNRIAESNESNNILNRILGVR